jgi:hypothetical protein
LSSSSVSLCLAFNDSVYSPLKHGPIYGSYPQIQVGLLASDEAQARRILASADWVLLQERLFGYVKNYSHKIVPVRNGFQF